MSEKMLSARVPREMDLKLATLAVENGTSKQALVIEALGDLFNKYEEVEKMREELSKVIANTTPPQAWEGWVGEQSVAEFVVCFIDDGCRSIVQMVRQYVRELPETWPEELGCASQEQLEQIAALLLQYINEQLQYDPDGRADDLLERFDMDTLAHYMDADIRETLHNHLAPCTDDEFLRAYLELHREKFGSEFEIN